MSIFKFSIPKLVSFLVLLFSTGNVFAGSNVGTMTMSFSTTAVPSLSGAMLVVLSLLLFAIAFRTAKQKQNKKFFVALVSSGALLAAIGSTGQLTNNFDAKAIGWFPTIDFSRTITTRNISPGFSEYTNTDPVLTGTITDITVNSPYTCVGHSNTCAVGLSLAPTEQCELLFSRPEPE